MKKRKISRARPAKKKVSAGIKTTRRDLLKTIAAATVFGSAAASAPQSKASGGADDLDTASEEDLSAKAASWHRYTMKLSVYVPRIYNNNKSRGSRKYQRQQIVGKLYIGFDTDGNMVAYKFKDFVNKTHKLANGKNVTYRVEMDTDACYPKFNAIGSNKTNIFKTASICFAIGAEPSYNIGEYDEDTSLFVTLGGKGTISKKGYIQRVKGYLAGSLGCGCAAYGHVSPTRKIGRCGAADQVVDVAAVHGTWTMKFDKI